MRFVSEFRKFSALLFLFSGFASSAVNVSVAGNAEIADFIVSESNSVLQIPSETVLTLDFQTAKDSYGRAGFLFFIGQRDASISANYAISLENSEQLKGTVKADTSWLTGYCGIIECRTWTMPAQQRIDIYKLLVQKLLAELDNKITAAFALNAIKKAMSADSAPAPADSAAAPMDSSAAPAAEPQPQPE